jgi:hypothetical protein
MPGFSRSPLPNTGCMTISLTRKPCEDLLAQPTAEQSFAPTQDLSRFLMLFDPKTISIDEFLQERFQRLGQVTRLVER